MNVFLSLVLDNRRPPQPLPVNLTRNVLHSSTSRSKSFKAASCVLPLSSFSRPCCVYTMWVASTRACSLLVLTCSSTRTTAPKPPMASASKSMLFTALERVARKSGNVRKENSSRREKGRGRVSQRVAMLPTPHTHTFAGSNLSGEKAQAEEGGLGCCIGRNNFHKLPLPATSNPHAPNLTQTT